MKINLNPSWWRIEFEHHRKEFRFLMQLPLIWWQWKDKIDKQHAADEHDCIAEQLWAEREGLA